MVTADHSVTIARVRDCLHHEPRIILDWLLEFSTASWHSANNCTDRRYQQYKALFPQILAEVDKGNLPPVFNNVWPPSPALQTATASSGDFQTLKDRFGKCYEHARKAAVEFDKRCHGIALDETDQPVRPTIWEKLGLA